MRSASATLAPGCENESFAQGDCENTPPANGNGDLHVLSYRELQKRAKASGIKAGGKKAELIARIAEAERPHANQV